MIENIQITQINLQKSLIPGEQVDQVDADVLLITEPPRGSFLNKSVWNVVSKPSGRALARGQVHERRHRVTSENGRERSLGCYKWRRY